MMMKSDKKFDRCFSALVTGASGQIGIPLVEELSAMDWQVLAVSRQNSFSGLKGVTHLPHNWETPIDFDLPEVDVVFHLASQTSSYVARSDVMADVRSNLLGTVSLLESVANTKSKPVFIFSGSMTEYGMAEKGFIDETTPLDPQTFYDSAKIATQIYAEQFAREGWLSKSITLRLPNVYGNTSSLQNHDRGFLDRSVWRALSGEPLTYFGSGEYRRDFLHIEDVVEALIAAFIHSESLNHAAFNVGTGIGTSIRDALTLVASKSENLTGKPVRIEQSEFPEKSYRIERRDSIVDANLFRTLSGWQPKITFEDGIGTSVLNAWRALTV
jgi:nucleoside-diphosphate-sugar epimerase